MPGPLRPLDDRDVVAAMRVVGATSPRRACRLEELPPEVQARLPELVERGLVREGAPGTYYLFATVSPAQPTSEITGFTWSRFIRTLIFWIILILLPIIYLHLSRKR